MAQEPVHFRRSAQVTQPSACRSIGSARSALERSDHHLDQRAVTEIGYSDRCSRRQIVTEEFGPGRIHFLFLRQIRHEDRGADDARRIRSRLFQITRNLAEGVAGLRVHRDAGVVGYRVPPTNTSGRSRRS
jgi:hypothetical protein